MSILNAVLSTLPGIPKALRLALHSDDISPEQMRQVARVLQVARHDVLAAATAREKAHNAAQNYRRPAGPGGQAA